MQDNNLGIKAINPLPNDVENRLFTVHDNTWRHRRSLLKHRVYSFFEQL